MIASRHGTKCGRLGEAGGSSLCNSLDRSEIRLILHMQRSLSYRIVQPPTKAKGEAEPEQNEIGAYIEVPCRERGLVFASYDLSSAYPALRSFALWRSPFMRRLRLNLRYLRHHRSCSHFL